MKWQVNTTHNFEFSRKKRKYMRHARQRTFIMRVESAHSGIVDNAHSGISSIVELLSDESAKKYEIFLYQTKT